MDKIDEINQELIQLWKNEFKNDDEVRLPLFYPALNKDAELLFIGLNPSFSKRIEPKTQEWFLWKEFAKREYSADDVREVQKMERRAKSCYSYYALFREIACYCGVEWEHIDLFFFRKTEQADFKDIVSDVRSFKQLNDFGKKQLELSKQLICYCQPKVIVVANRGAWKIFEREFKPTCIEEKRRYMTQLNAVAVPTFSVPITLYMRKAERRQLKREIKKTLKSQSKSQRT